MSQQPSLPQFLSRAFVVALALASASVAFASDNTFTVDVDFREPATTTPATTTPATSSPPVVVETPSGVPNTNGSIMPIMLRGINVPETISGGTTYSFDANVYDVRTETTNRSVQIFWTNPNAPAFDSVRIVRSELFYPADIVEGKVVYEGTGTRLFDTDVQENVTYFYTIFSKDTNGHFSSGVAVCARTTSAFSGGFTEQVARPLETKLRDFTFSQNEQQISVLGLIVPIQRGTVTFVTVPFEKVPPETKDMLFGVSRGDGSEYATVRFEPDVERQQFFAFVPPLFEPVAMRISFYDYAHRSLGYIRGSFVVQTISEAGFVPENRILYVDFALAVLVILLVLQRQKVIHTFPQKRQ